MMMPSEGQYVGRSPNDGANHNASGPGADSPTNNRRVQRQPSLGLGKSFDFRFGTGRTSNSDSHVINVPDSEVRQPTILEASAAPLIQFTRMATGVISSTTEKLHTNVSGVISATTEKISATTEKLQTNMSDVLSATSEKLNVGVVVDSMTNVLNGSFISWKNTTDTYGIESRLMEAQEQHTRLKMQVFWQLLLTGFEVATYRVGKRAKKRVLWLALDGRLYLDGSKKDKKSSSAMFLYDVFKIQRGSEAVAFTKSTSAREARNKDELSFSIHGKHGKEEEKVFACQVLKGSVRTIVVENLETLLQLIQGDSDGEYPVNVQKRIALHYAATGDVLTLRQVEDMLRHEEGKADFRTAFEELSDDEDDSGNESDSHKSDGQRKILG